MLIVLLIMVTAMVEH
jgi:ABC-type amino acid transport system permease subunit